VLVQRVVRPGLLRVVAIPFAAMVVVASLALGAPVRAADSPWPRQFDSPSGPVVIYQPQPEDLDGDVLSCRAAFSVQRSADGDPIFGVLWFTERIQIDRDSSTVTPRNLDVTKVRLPGITQAEADRYETLVESEAKGWDLSSSLDQLKAGLAATEKERASVADLDNDPPRIRFVYERAILLQFDGSPVLEPIEGSRLERVANTPYAVVHDPASGAYYLSGANVAYQAKDPLGPWSVVPRLPASVRAVVPPDTSADDQVQGPPPRVITATVPPQYAPLVGDELLYVTNTESDVVRMVSSQALYVLLSGRWYRAATPDGPWIFVRGDQLPSVFAKVPLDSPKGNILASVAGTDQADDAVADAEIPQTSAIRRDESDFQVDYDGSPDFEPIEGTDMQYAMNTDAEVILADGRYYACDQGVWYVADSPDGPWQVSETRPLGIEDIPPSCPVYDVQYVYIYDVTPSYVYCGYLPGYLGCYPYYGSVVYGTGYRYNSWRGHRHYYPRPCTWGFHPRYNPWLGRWSFGYTFGSGFLRTGYRWRPGPRLEHPHGAPRWFGPGGYRRPMIGADLAFLRTRRPSRSPLRAADTSPMNLYRRSTNVGRVDRIASRLPLRPIAASPARTPNRPNNVFAGRDGRVYQRDQQGIWKVNEGRAWKPARLPVQRPARPLVPGSGAPGGGTARNWPPPMPPQPIVPRENQPPRPSAPPLRPAVPVIRPGPGDLQKEFRARERSGPTLLPDPAHPAPKPEAPPPPPKPRKNPLERKP